MRIKDYLREIGILPDVRTPSKADLFQQLCDHLHKSYPKIKDTELLSVLMHQEDVACSYAGHGIGIPNTLVKGLSETVCLIARIQDGIDYQTPDHDTVNLIFLIVSPPERAGTHIRLIARIARFSCHPEFCREMIAAPDGETLLERLNEEDLRYV
jgi:nitrogen PTS system EIIA component